jgi:solute carrier family 6 amino acid transporter-like protein 5/7/9/14
MGQFSTSNSVRVWDMVPAVRGVGFGQAIATSSVVSYYTCLIALAVFYLIASFTSVLPWVICDPDIASPSDDGTVCIDDGLNASDVIDNVTILHGGDILDYKPMSSAEQYFT